MDTGLNRVVVTGGAGQIAYSLLFKLASGDLFGKGVPLELNILELPEMLRQLEGIKMELEDCAFPELKKVRIGSNPEELFEGVTHAFLVGAKPRGPGMERKELLTENSKIFVAQGAALNKVADQNVKVLVLGNPCNTNCLIALQNAPNLNFKNFHAMTRLDQNRATFQLAHKAQVSIDQVSHVAIWGNHSSTQFPDFIHARIAGQPAGERIEDRQWLENTFITTVQKRGAAVIDARGKSSAASAANAALDAMKAIIAPTAEGQWYSSAIYSKNNPYNVDQNLIFSFPCRTKTTGEVEIVSGLELNDFMKEKLNTTEKELIEEREMV